MFDKHRLDVLLGRYFDQTLTPQQREQFELRLESSAEARAAFWKYARIHNLLRELAQQRTSDRFVELSLVAQGGEVENDSRDIELMFQDECVESTLLRRRPSIYQVLMGVAASLALLLAAWHITRPVAPLARPPHTVIASSPVEIVSKAVAVVTGAVGIESEAHRHAYNVGATLDPGIIKLQKGFLQIDFFSGARVTLQGPVELKLVSTMEMECLSGRLSADVPPQARGFRINTPRMDVVDLGTSFGMDVDSDQMEVHVFTGEVELHNENGKVRSLYEGQAETVNESGRLRSFTSVPDQFVRSKGLRNRLEANFRDRHQRWLSDGDNINQDPSLLFRFDMQNPQENTLNNRVRHTPSTADGLIVGGSWTTGRWPGKSAFAFSSISDRVRLSVPGQFDSVTLAAWVRINGTERLYSSLFMTDDFFPGALHWQVYHDGRVLLGICPPDGQHADFYSSKSINSGLLGQWIHLSVVYDSQAREVRHYLNGAPASRESVRFSQPVRIGKAELGNWNPGSRPIRYPMAEEPRPIRNLNGSMDEFEFFTRALSDAEIQNLHLQGAPW